ncbi:MAG: diguanylate cyclase domain-containing protein [Coriobacteriales bacterium]
MKARQHARGNEHSIFLRVLIPLMALVAIEVVIMLCTVALTNVAAESSQNARSIVSGKLSARATYLQSTMVNDWMNIGQYVGRSNKIVEEKIESGAIRKDELGQDDAANDALLAELSHTTLNMMRASCSTGAYLVLNTQDLDQTNESGQRRNLPGIYLRDLDPLSRPTGNDSDILIERSPATVIDKLGIATDRGWNARFDFSTADTPYYPFLYEPFEKALHAKGAYSWSDLGYWSFSAGIFEEDRPAITYSVPLMLSDGTVYGVLGIDLTDSYLETLLPADELADDGSGSYFVGVASPDNDDVLDGCVSSGKLQWQYATDDGRSLELDRVNNYVDTIPLKNFSSNVPYDDTTWVIGCTVPTTTIDKRANAIQLAFTIAAAAVLVVGIVGSLLVAFIILRPMRRLEHALKGTDASGVVVLPSTGIREVDSLSREVERLSRDIMENGQRFSKTIEMATESLGSFQADEATGALYISDGFFEVFGMKAPAKPAEMTVAAFDAFLEKLAEHSVEAEAGIDGEVFEIGSGSDRRYVRLRIAQDGTVRYGLAEDITQLVLRERMLVFERDHDALTGMLNHKAFQNAMASLLEEGGKTFACAALLMMDLDNLKLVNDSYGHAVGDEYIKAAADTIVDALPKHALCARISGDEFNVFVYGSTREEVRGHIIALRDAFSSAAIDIGGHEQRSVRISAGISWYPKDSTSYESLLRFADSAMYVAKSRRKGTFENFDMRNYRGEEELRIKREAFVVLLEQRLLHYVFQPIVEAKTARIYAYEALMRPDHEAFKSPLDVLSTARLERKLNQVEELAVPLAIQTFVAHRATGKIAPHTKLFFNTIANPSLPAAAAKAPAKETN